MPGAVSSKIYRRFPKCWKNFETVHPRPGLRWALFCTSSEIYITIFHYEEKEEVTGPEKVPAQRSARELLQRRVLEHEPALGQLVEEARGQVGVVAAVERA